MAKRVIRVTRINVDDWVVREEGGRDLGHYSNQQEALSVGRKLARTRGVELIVEESPGKVRSERPRKGFLARLLGR